MLLMLMQRMHFLLKIPQPLLLLKKRLINNLRICLYHPSIMSPLFSNNINNSKVILIIMALLLLRIFTRTLDDHLCQTRWRLVVELLQILSDMVAHLLDCFQTLTLKLVCPISFPSFFCYLFISFHLFFSFLFKENGTFFISHGDSMVCFHLGFLFFSFLNHPMYA